MSIPTIAVAYGDGNAPEVMESVLTILREAGAPIRIETVEIGSRIYAMGSETGILPLAWPVLQRTGVLLMAPIEAPENKQHTAEAIKERMGLADVEPECFHPLTLTLSPAGAEGSGVFVAGEGEATAKAYKNESFALFQPIYKKGSLDKKGRSDPSPMLHATIIMLMHIGLHDTAHTIQNAWIAAIEDGFGKKRSKNREKFVAAITERLGRLPARCTPAHHLGQPQ
ncbi:MAG: hypothetical protein AB7L92_03140 [Alphaproteobacteria bacterium]